MSVIPKVAYARLRSDNDPDFESFYAIYEEALPLRERKSKAVIADIASREDYQILLLKSKAEVLGFSIVYIAAQSTFCLLEYMAIRSEHRSLGFGAQLFMHTFQHVYQDFGKICALIEVDSDRERSPDRAVRTRRLMFYRKLGCLCIADLAYLLPLPGKGDAPQMDLLAYLPESINTISRDHLKQWLSNIFKNVYDCEPDDPRIAKMMKQVADPVVLR